MARKLLALALAAAFAACATPPEKPYAEGKRFFVSRSLILRKVERDELPQAERAARENFEKELQERLREAVENVVHQFKGHEARLVGEDAPGAHEVRVIYREAKASWFHSKDLQDEIEVQLWAPGAARPEFWITTPKTVDQKTGSGVSPAARDAANRLLVKMGLRDAP